MKTIVSSKGQVVIPASIRKKFDLRPGTELEVKTRGNALIFQWSDSSLDTWLKNRTKRGPLEEPLNLDRSAAMPPAPKL